MKDNLDKIDRTVLFEMQKNSDRRLFQIEKETKIPRSTINNLIRKLKDNKIITKIKAVVDPEKLGLGVCALIHIVISHKKGIHEIARKIAALPNVEEIYITAGVFDVIAKVRFRNNAELSHFIFDDKNGLKVWEGIERTESMICLETIKENGILE